MEWRGFDNKAKRAWWQVHVEAQARSGLSVAEYCREHGLWSGTFTKWRRELTDEEAQKSAKRAYNRRVYRRVSPENRLRAKKAFWAMHMEAWQWSGMHLRDYAKAFRLSLHNMRKWRTLMEAGELSTDWRGMLHPSAVPPLSTKVSPRTKERERAQALTAAIEADAGPAKRAPRRNFTTEQKVAILLEAERDGESVSSVGRKHGIATSVLFRWRDQLGLTRDEPAVLVPIRVVENEMARAGAPSLLAEMLPRPDGMAEIELADGRRVFAPAGADPNAVRREVAEREMQP
jgi:transposase-like protein